MAFGRFRLTFTAKACMMSFMTKKRFSFHPNEPAGSPGTPAGALIALCWFVYFASYLTRQNYNAALALMLGDLGAAKSALSLAGTGAFAAYGIGQPVSALLLRRARPRRMIAIGLLASGCCNLLLAGSTLAFSGPGLPVIMTVIWCANGFAQAMLWPALVQFMARELSAADYNRAVMHVNIAGSAGTAAVYLLAGAARGSWRWVFVISASFAVIAALAWRKLAPDTPLRQRFCEAPTLSPLLHPNEPADSLGAPAGEGGFEVGNAQLIDEPGEPVPMRRLLTGFGLGPILLGAALLGILRESVPAWMPVLLTESAPAFSSARSVLTAAVLPLFAIVSLRVTGTIAKKIGHELRSTAWFFGAGTLAALGLALCLHGMRAGALPMGNLWLPMGVACMALLTGCMHGVNLAAVCQLPARFGKYGATGAAAGVINAFVYAGSALSMLGTALLAERRGWQATAWAWLAVAAAGTAVFVFFTKKAKEKLYE